MTRRSSCSRFLRALSAALLLIALSASSVLAGEVTGKDDPTPIQSFRAKSICSFSGLNDKEIGEGPTAPRVQNWGVTPNPAFHPSEACNGHTGWLSGS